MKKMILFFTLIFAQPSFAIQEKEQNLEKIKVTGSRITRIDTQGPSPLIIYNKEDLENSGYSSAGDFLRDTNISHFGVSREEAGSSASGESFAQIKGETSLILIDGLRVAEDPSTNSVDLNLIPLFAIERIEVLKDGAAALYGSDAVGGVINFITKKASSGIEVHAQIVPTIKQGVELKDISTLFNNGGTRADVATIFGDSNEKGFYLGSVHLRFQDSIKNSERVWTNETISPVGPYGVFNNQVDPNCPTENKTSDGCEIDLSDLSSRQPLYAQLYAYLQGHYNLDESVLYTQAIASYKYNKWFYAPIPGGLALPTGHKMSFGQGKEGLLKYRFMEAGQRDTTYNNFIADLTIGNKGYLSTTWDYDFSVKLAHIRKDETQEGLLLTEELTKAIVNGDYDPFDKTKRQLLNAPYTGKSNNYSNLYMSSLDLSGEAGFWNLDLATGFQAYFKDYTNKADEKAKEGKVLSNAGSDGYGKRHVLSYYLEGVKNFSDMLEVQLAGRTDYYSDFGWTINPKLAFRLQPQSRFLIRGSIGTAFVAPSLALLNQSDSEGYPHIFDTVACYNELKQTQALKTTKSVLGDQSEEDKDTFVKSFLIEQKDIINQENLSTEVKTELENLSQSFAKTNYCTDRQIFTKSSGNKELKETKALVASLGSHVQLSDEHSLTLDLWYIKKSGVPSDGVSKKTIDAELKFGNDYVKTQGIVVNRNPKHEYKALYNGPKHGITTKLLNLGNTQKAGMDLAWNSDFSNINLFNGSPYLSNQISYILFSKAEGFPGIGYVDDIGKFGRPQWRNIANIGWKNKKHNFSLTAYTTAAFGKQSSELENLPMYTRLDLDYQFVMNEKTSFKFGFSNVLFSTPPFDKDVNNNKLDHSVFESRGPFFFAGIKYAI